MSLRSKKQAKEAGKKRAEPQRPLLQRPTGPLPTASVMARHAGEMIARSSKGFSYGEVESAGVAVATAKKWGLPLDMRRRSVLAPNVKVLKAWYARAKQVGKTGELKKLEEELEKVEKEVKKGVAKAKKEAVKVEKEAEKLEKEVVEKVEEPVKARRGKKKAEKNSE